MSVFRCAVLSAVKHDYVARGVLGHPRFDLAVDHGLVTRLHCGKPAECGEDHLPFQSAGGNQKLERELPADHRSQGHQHLGIAWQGSEETVGLALRSLEGSSAELTAKSTVEVFVTREWLRSALTSWLTPCEDWSLERFISSHKIMPKLRWRQFSRKKMARLIFKVLPRKF